LKLHRWRKSLDFKEILSGKNGPVYYAIDNDRVVGWCDVFPFNNPRQSHRGGLGMGLIPEYRGQGLGSKLLSSVIEHSKQFGLEKIELNVYTSKHVWYRSL
jgi:GNAT superfamily N-acetyltransferase